MTAAAVGFPTVKRLNIVMTDRRVVLDLLIVDPSLLFVSMFVGTVGLAVLTFGKKAGRVVPLACGVLLMLVSYVAPSVPTMLVASTMVVAVPFFVRG